MKIYLIRHGEVENPRDVLYGRLPNFHLSEEGKSHIQKVAQNLMSAGITKIYSSPLERTHETAAIIAKSLKIPEKEIITDERLTEIDCGDLAGMPMREFYAKTGYDKDPFGQAFVESIFDAGKRIVAVLGEITRHDETVAVVSHGDPLSGAEMIIANDKSMHDKYLKKGDFVRLDHTDGKWSIAEINVI